MTIEELINKLKTFPLDMVVLVDGKTVQRAHYVGGDYVNISSEPYVNVKKYLED